MKAVILLLDRLQPCQVLLSPFFASAYRPTSGGERDRGLPLPFHAVDETETASFFQSLRADGPCDAGGAAEIDPVGSPFSAPELER